MKSTHYRGTKEEVKALSAFVKLTRASEAFEQEMTDLAKGINWGMIGVRNKTNRETSDRLYKSLRPLFSASGRLPCGRR